MGFSAEQAGEQPSSRQCQRSRDHFWWWSNIPAWGHQGAIHAHREQIALKSLLLVRHAGFTQSLGKNTIRNVLTKLKIHPKTIRATYWGVLRLH